METWKRIPSTDYSVSDLGRVASHKRGLFRVLKSRPDGCGYPQAGICSGGVSRNFLVHRLVALAFLGPPPTPAHQVNHKDGIPSNNCVGNLEWTTSGENTRHAFRVLGKHGPRGELNGAAALTETQVREIRARRAAGELLTSIAADYGISSKNVQHIAVRRSWAWLV